ncbi:MAG: adenosylhomocysteinase [Clostridiales bacterium]|nr:adenosylhomocysteinase [Clostridiales bacterium]MDD7035626.1 adenosylhomocysteinase [Bacillota bacterium]MDY2920223.1 adenosylhomocysteinase [Lentihominibacter sp.]
MEYDIRDINLAPSGEMKISWVKNNMPLLRGLEEEFLRDKPFDGVKISLSVHLEAKTAYLCRVLAAGGAQMSVTGSNSLSTQDDIAAALAAGGMKVFAYHGATDEEYNKHIEMCLEHKPNIIIDDGGDLVSLIHNKRPDLGEECWGGCEETTTGVIRLKAMEREGILKFPMVAVNDADCKHLFDNRYGTGQSVWDSIMRNTNLIVASKTVVTVGYGWCGRGIAMRAAALGARVIVTEIDPVKAIEARMDGYDVMPMAQAAPLGDIFVTATGCMHTITTEHMKTMKDRAILANAGHFNVEIDMAGLEKEAVDSYPARNNITAYVLPGGKTVNVIGEGKLANIAAGDGHPAEIMDMSFAVQALSAGYVLEAHKNAKNGAMSTLPNKVIDVSSEIDEIVARRKLDAWGIEIDTLTPEQKEYLESWEV